MAVMREPIVYVITGATSGVGEALAKRLLEEAPSIAEVVLCLACRNLKKASIVRESLLSSFPSATVDMVYLDTSQPATAVQAAKELKLRYKHVNYLYFNAGIMPVSGLNWGAFWPPTPSNYSKLFGTGVGLLNQQDGTTVDGMKLVFTTNVTGHYVMLKELEPFLEEQGKPCHVIWTSSSSANNVEMDHEDLQNTRGVNPYHTSKRAVDLLSMGLNDKLNTKNIFSDVICPGLVISQMTYGMLPKWVWYCLMPLWFLIRMFVTNFYTLSPGNGAEALVWLAKNDPSSLDHTLKYMSMCSAYGKRYIRKVQMKVSEESANTIVTKLDSIAEPFLQPPSS